MKKNYMKTLLVAAGLLVGSMSAWAQTSLYERGTTNAWASTDIAEGQWTGSGGTLELNADPTGMKYTSPSNGGGFYSKSIETQDNSVITVNATWYVGSSTGRSGNHNILQLGSLQFRAYGQDQFGGLYDIGNGSYSADGTKIIQFGGKDDVRTSEAWIITLTINKATGAVAYTVDLPSSEDVSGETTLASVSFDNIGLGFVRGGRTGTSNSTLSKIEVLEKVQTVSTANYTVKFVDEAGNEIKDASTRSGVVGSDVVLTADDTKNFFTADNSVKYIYKESDIEGKTISEGLVVTVTFREAETYTYTLNAVVSVGEGEDVKEELLKELASGENFEGEETTVYYPRSINVDGKWYTISTSDYRSIFTQAETRSLVYAEDESIDYFFEVESINAPNGYAASGSYPERYSSGKAGRLAGGRYAYTEPLNGGVYTLTMWGRNQAGSSTANIQIIVRDPEGNDSDPVTFAEDWATGGQGTKTYEGIIVPVGSYIVLKNTSDEYNSNLEMDYIILTKTDNVEAIYKDATISEVGYATFSSPYALQLNDLYMTAYIIEGVNGTQLTLKAVDNVPANTGVLLAGPAGNYSFPVIASCSTDVSANLLVGVAADTEITSGYVLQNQEEKGLGFYLVDGTKTVPAGKAYLNYSVPEEEEAKALYFDSNATAIEAISALTSDAVEGIYTVGGAKLNSLQKGINIVKMQNGTTQKVLVK